MTLDVAAARADTPGVESVIHLNSAGASLSPRPVVDTVVEHVRREAEIGGYEAASEANDRLEAVYDALAALIGAQRHEIACIENATRAWDMAFYSMRFETGDRILTTTTEYASNFIAFLQARRRDGVEVEVVPDDERGGISMDALREAVRRPAALIAINHVPTGSGLVNPAVAVGEVARRRNIPYLLDACQSVGQMPIDVERIGCDFLTASGRKFLRGPRGTGFLFVREPWIERLEPVMLDLHAATWVAPDEYVIRPDARRFENWETNVAAKLGLGEAARYAIAVGLDAVWERVRLLAEGLRDRLASIPEVTVRDVGSEQCGIVTFTHPAGPEAVEQRLHDHDPPINVSVSTAASQRLDFEGRGLERVVRASVHYFNTEEELGLLVAAL